MKFKILLIICWINIPVAFISSQVSSDTISRNIELDEVQVKVSHKATSLKNVARITSIISKKELETMPVQSVQDVLDYISGVDLRQRGPGGIQADVSIRGGTFDQTIIMLNGINITDPQTGHLSMNLPVDMSCIERVEILEGPGAKVFGPNAFSGAVNFVTVDSESSFVRARITAGEYGYVNSGFSTNVSSGKYRSFLSGQYSKSNGYHSNTDFNQYNLYYNGKLKLNGDELNFQLGCNNKSFGAFAFYTPAYPFQYEQNRTFLSSISFKTGRTIKVSPTLYWRRNHDRFELERSNPEGYINYHLNDVFGGNVNAETTWRFGTTAFGGEIRNESIFSNNIGSPMEKTLPVPGEDSAFFDKSYSRVNTSFFLEHTFNIKRFTSTLGVLMNLNSGLDYKARIFPGIDMSYWINDHLKLIGAINKSLRMPTFTDLFYLTSTAVGDRNLKPEEVWGYGTGVKYIYGGLLINVNGFYRYSRNSIDWVRVSNDDPYHVMNMSKINSYGTQFNTSWVLQEEISKLYFIQSVTLDYLYQTQDKKLDTGYDSRYVMDYLKNKLVVKLNHRIIQDLDASWALIYQDRQGSYKNAGGEQIAYEDFVTLDLKLSWDKKKYSLYAEMSNMTDKTVYDIGNVPLPGRWTRAGMIIHLDL